MTAKEYELALRDLIHKAIHTQHPKNPFFYDQRKKEEDQLLKGIEERNSKAEYGSAGSIDLDLTLGKLLDNRDAFLQDIDDFIASRNNGKYQYALRFETLLNYLNDFHRASLSTDFLKKYLFKDDDRRTLEILKRMHSWNIESNKSMAVIAEEFGVDIKTIRRDFARLETNFSFLDTDIKINGFNAHYNSPVHPVFLALNSSQLYGLFYALKVLSTGTVLEEFSDEISNSVYSQLSAFARGLVSDLYARGEFPEDFHNEHNDSRRYYRLQNRQVVFHAAAYKIACTVTFDDAGKEKTVTGIPKVIRDDGHHMYSLQTDVGEIVTINADHIIKAKR